MSNKTLDKLVIFNDKKTLNFIGLVFLMNSKPDTKLETLKNVFINLGKGRTSKYYPIDKQAEVAEAISLFINTNGYTAYVKQLVEVAIDDPYYSLDCMNNKVRKAIVKIMLKYKDLYEHSNHDTELKVFTKDYNSWLNDVASNRVIVEPVKKADTSVTDKTINVIMQIICPLLGQYKYEKNDIISMLKSLDDAIQKFELKNSSMRIHREPLHININSKSINFKSANKKFQHTVNIATKTNVFVCSNHTINAVKTRELLFLLDSLFIIDLVDVKSVSKKSKDTNQFSHYGYGDNYYMDYCHGWQDDFNNYEVVNPKKVCFDLGDKVWLVKDKNLRNIISSIHPQLDKYEVESKQIKDKKVEVL
jgi:hypothetical protein